MPRISKRYYQFNGELEALIGYLTVPNRARLGIRDDQYDGLVAKLPAWSAAFNAYKNPETRTQPVNSEMKRLYKDYEALVRGIRQQVKNLQGVPLTGDDYAALGIHQNKTTRTRHTRPDYAPSIKLIRIAHLENEFEVQHPDSVNINRLALPTGLKLARKLAITEPLDPPPEASAYEPIDEAGRGKFTLNFDLAQEGKIGYIICSYFNSRGEHGPESPPLRFYIN